VVTATGFFIDKVPGSNLYPETIYPEVFHGLTSFFRQILG